MLRKRVYPVWIMEFVNNTYYGRNFDFGVEAEGETLKEVLKELKDKIEKKAYFQELEGLEIPSPGIGHVENMLNYNSMELIPCDLDRYYKKNYNLQLNEKKF